MEHGKNSNLSGRSPDQAISVGVGPNDLWDCRATPWSDEQLLGTLSYLQVTGTMTLTTTQGANT